jgi:hypothetical protein
MPNQKSEKKRWSKLRWKDGVDNDIKALRERNWKNIAKNRQIWLGLLRKAMAQKELFCQ